MPDTDPRHILISLNPKAGRSSSALRAERLQAILKSHGYIVELLTDLDEVQEKANRLYQAGELKVLVGVGGDGTAAELTNRTVPGTPITLLPAGTANLIAKEYRLSPDPKKAARMIEIGETVSLDAGMAGGRLFLVMLTAGIDAHIVEQVHRNREEAYRRPEGKGGHINYRSYLGPVFRSIRNYTYPLIKIESCAANQFRLVSKPVSWAFLFNIPRYGFGTATTPRCRPDDGLIDLCGFHHRGIVPALLGVFLSFLGGTHRISPGYSFAKAEGFRLFPADSSSEPIPYQLDGDPGGNLPVEIQIVPKRLTLLIWKKKRFFN